MTEDAFRRYLAEKLRQAGGRNKFAAVIGEDESNLSKMVSGKRGPSPKVLQYLGLEVGYEFVRLPTKPGEEE